MTDTGQGKPKFVRFHPMSLNIEHSEPDAETSVIRLAGKLLLGSGCLELEALINAQLEAGRRHLIFDLSRVSHIDSTGMGRFIDAYNRMQDSGGKIGLAGASGSVRDMFHVTRLDTVFSFYDTVSDACSQA